MIYIDSLEKKRIRIGKVLNGETVSRYLDFATWKATLGAGGSITLEDMSGKRRITGNIAELVINGQPAPEDELEVSNALEFIGAWGKIEIDDIRQVAAGEINNAEAVIGEIKN